MVTNSNTLPDEFVRSRQGRESRRRVRDGRDVLASCRRFMDTSCLKSRRTEAEAGGPSRLVR